MATASKSAAEPLLEEIVTVTPSVSTKVMLAGAIRLSRGSTGKAKRVWVVRMAVGVGYSLSVFKPPVGQALAFQVRCNGQPGCKRPVYLRPNNRRRNSPSE